MPPSSSSSAPPKRSNPYVSEITLAEQRSTMLMLSLRVLPMVRFRSRHIKFSELFSLPVPSESRIDSETLELLRPQKNRKPAVASTKQPPKEVVDPLSVPLPSTSKIILRHTLFLKSLMKSHPPVRRQAKGRDADVKSEPLSDHYNPIVLAAAASARPRPIQLPDEEPSSTLPPRPVKRRRQTRPRPHSIMNWKNLREVLVTYIARCQ
jgi:hypothetical protein